MTDAGEKVAQATRQRAAAYAHLFLVLRKRLGEAQAIDLMSEAIYNLGKEKSRRNYSARAQSGDLAQAAREFASPDPVKQHQFAPRIVSLTPEEAVIRMSKCPLVDEWKAMGLPARDVETLCNVAHSVDFGTWEGTLRCELHFEGTRGAGCEECVLRVKRAKAEE